MNVVHWESTKLRNRCAVSEIKNSIPGLASPLITGLNLRGDLLIVPIVIVPKHSLCNEWFLSINIDPTNTPLQRQIPTLEVFYIFMIFWEVGKKEGMDTLLMAKFYVIWLLVLVKHKGWQRWAAYEA